MNALAPWPGRLIAWLALALAAAPALAIDEKDLLPVDDAFRLEAEAVTPGWIEFRWKVAPGYYLYKERIKVVLADDATFKANPLHLPPGKIKEDQFFGRMETYRDSVVAKLTGAASDGVTLLRFKVSYQGCADAGICYPPQRKEVVVSLPQPDRANADPPAMDPVATAAPGLSLPGTSSATETTSTVPVVAAPVSLSLPGAATAAPAAVEALPLPEAEAFQVETIATSSTELLARFTMPKDYYLYRDRTGFILEDPSVGDLGAPKWPASRSFDDPEFGRVEVFFDLVEIPITLARKEGAARDIALRVNLQGCQLDGICYPPMTRILTVSMPAASADELASARAAIAPGGVPELRAAEATPSPAEGSADFFANSLRSGNRWFAMLVFLLVGIGLAFTPCVFPMVPILSGIVAGAGDNLSTRRAFVLSLTYVLASAVVFTVVGVFAGLAGQNLQALFQKPWILVSFALVFVALALSMFGFYELQLPSRWQTRLTTTSNKVEGGSLTGVAIMGALSALIVGPCVAPPLAGAVVYLADQGSGLRWVGAVRTRHRHGPAPARFRHRCALAAACRALDGTGQDRFRRRLPVARAVDAGAHPRPGLGDVPGRHPAGRQGRAPACTRTPAGKSERLAEDLESDRRDLRDPRRAAIHRHGFRCARLDTTTGKCRRRCSRNRRQRQRHDRTGLCQSQLE
ncbi:MAG: hypothetical protein IPO95_07335 [Rhodanobacteraceae bacterium]|nr:hypothetical protein [Rhodanobacteraceae bacterium]